MGGSLWQFCIDVGGTFADVVARGPEGRLHTFKLLSTGAVRGRVGPGSGGDRLVDPARSGEVCDLWVGYEVAIPLPGGGVHRATVRSFDPVSRAMTLDAPLPELSPDPERATTHFAYELRSGEEAPVMAIRRLLGLRLDEPIPAIDVRLGTTRATNALLERKGAKTALLTTEGFGDVLKIGNQDRPELFSLRIRKRDELAASVVEISERLAADGSVLVPIDDASVCAQLAELAAGGFEALAVCLLHAHTNPVHEERIAALAAGLGFAHVSLSSRVARLERIVPRGDTTVLDAYLSPVIRGYVSALRRSMPDARIMLMTSAGGLLAEGGVSGKDTILSGPAGGVLGCRHVAAECAALASSRVIGFDMGGTSTDVSRVDGETLEYQHETVKAGVRMMTPMLAVETVAAGGGSLCAFDGQRLTVGPRSAGAEPGPACYGRGGPLTVTDMNVLLGRIPIGHFAFPLDPDAVERGLATLAEKLSTAGFPAHTPAQLAEGFIRIANEHMSAAIKRISIAKGYDLRTYALCAFGGAGGQHACAVAELLGMSRIVLSPMGGVLSALGIAAADVKRIGQRSFLVPLDGTASATLAPVLGELERELHAAFRADGFDSGQTAEPVRTLDLCYAGQATRITVTAGDANELATRFASAHRQLYGYEHTGRPIEIRVARVELTLPAGHPAARSVAARLGPLHAESSAPVVFGGSTHATPIYTRASLGAGDRLVGPAIVAEEGSTVVVEPGWEATVAPSGDLVLIRMQAAPGGTTSGDPKGESTDIDPVQLELFGHRFASVAEQMGATLRRTALSVNVKERLDYSCAVFDAGGRLVASAQHIPVHLGAMSDCVKALIEDVAAFNPGDVYVTNDPYRGGSHLNDVTVVTPVHFGPQNQRLFFVASRAHHAEIGGTRPGSMPPDSRCLADEGVLIRAFAWMKAGRPRIEEMRRLLVESPLPSRSPDENLADLAAQAAANRTGVAALTRLVEDHGRDVVRAYMGHIQASAAAKMRAALRRLAPGARHFVDRLDDGTPIAVRVEIEDGRAIVDFTGTGAVLPGNLNANRAIVTSAVLYCLRCLIDEDVPLCAGVLEPVQLVLPECLLNPPVDADPRHCPAMVGGNVETSQRVVDVMLGALGLAAASQGTMNNLLIGSESFGYYETICGGAGAGPGFDGADAVHTHMTNTRLTDPEVLESRYPLRLLRFEIRGGSGGKGRWHGGEGVLREIEFLAPLSVSIISQRRTRAPYGLAGGGRGAIGENHLVRAGTTRFTDLGSAATFQARRGDRLTILTPGGGGWGWGEPSIENPIMPVAAVQKSRGEGRG